MPDNFNQLTSKTTLYNVLEALKANINYNLNCVKVAKVEEFFSDNLTVSCKVANKRVLGLKEDGNQILQDYPLIYAKVHFIGWGDTGATYPITKGMEGLLLFNDRELETWFITGTDGNLAYDRCHSLSDAIFICGVHSLTNMIQMLTDCFHLFYKNSNIQIKDNNIIYNSALHTINGTTQINGNTTVTGVTTSDGLVDTTAATGTFTSVEGKVITVVNGIVTKITGT